jgi:hypothetical protein
MPNGLRISRTSIPKTLSSNKWEEAIVVDQNESIFSNVLCTYMHDVNIYPMFIIFLYHSLLSLLVVCVHG